MNQGAAIPACFQKAWEPLKEGLQNTSRIKKKKQKKKKKGISGGSLELKLLASGHAPSEVPRHRASDACAR